MEQLPKPVEDGLATPEVGLWAEDKYRILWLYASLFSSGMKKKWGKRIYVDLYSGAGQARVKGTSRLLYGSPLLALQVRDPFDSHVFCEEAHPLMESLKERTKRVAPSAQVTLVEGDCNNRIDDIVSAIPKFSKTQTVLTLCFVDPFDLGIQFETIATLARERITDFLVLLALYMDANRNYDSYIEAGSTKVERFLGDPDWRTKWAVAQKTGDSFPSFLKQAFASRMESLGYMPPPPMRTVRSQETNSPLYHLAIFSKSKRASEFWDQVLKYSSDQKELF